MKKKIKYYGDSKGEFVIENYNLSGSFSNFLPGIAGLFGIPMWVFYTNRAQCVCSFGIKSKDESIMEFLPANRAYQLTPSQGFRTFIKIKSDKRSIFHEPFKPQLTEASKSIDQKMFINSCELRLLETAPDIGLETEVTYFTIPNESFASLARVVKFKNISKRDLKLDVLDGAPLIIPYGVSDWFLKQMRRTVEAWMCVENIKKHAPFFKLKVDPSDISEVSVIDEGNFYLAALSKNKRSSQMLPVIIEPELIFGQASDFSYPVNFVDSKKFSIPDLQIGETRLPCAMSHGTFKIKKGDTVTLYSLIGHMSSKDKLNAMLPDITKESFFKKKKEENREIVHGLQETVLTKSSDKRYDNYCAQTFLDNVLRGGYPKSSKKNSCNFYVYSRKHGDIERDYNNFYLDPTYFSQGNGNFRDMNQNRRNDVLFNPAIKDSNILHFYNLQQLDGFNPLVLKGVRFKLKDIGSLGDIIKGMIDPKHIKELKVFLEDDFTPGKLCMYLEKNNLKLQVRYDEFLCAILTASETLYPADHVEGFWIDHWTYNLDLVENFLSVYPEKLRELLFDNKEYTFFDNIFYVKPRSDKCILNGNNNVRQYHSLAKDNKKSSAIKNRVYNPFTARDKFGEGKVYKTTLLVKMLCLAVNKIASIGACGVGIEMEADKPGWCDAINGLPALFGSSTPEVFELKRQIRFILDSFDNVKVQDSCKVPITKEIYDFLKKMEILIKGESKVSEKKRDFYYWDKANDIKESYREKTRYGVSGIEKLVTVGKLKKVLLVYLAKVNKSIKRSYNPSNKMYTTYFINEVTKYKTILKKGEVQKHINAKPTEFRNIKLPLFLEGVVRALKVEDDIKNAKKLHEAVKKSPLYDKKLKMYKINESLEGVSKEIGRTSVFSRGWLENESIWLHMEYKYILELLKIGLYKEFFEEMKNVLVPFLDPARYGRSIFENSSFIVSSVFPDKNIHGKGFIARLSGSTAEMLHIWLFMNLGKDPFFLDKKGELNLRFRPALPSWMFLKNTYTFKFLGDIDAVYHNPRSKDTVGEGAVRTRFIIIRYNDGKKVEIKKDIIELPYSEDIRNRLVKRIDIYLG
ncbi:MAG: cellobiose phosphorylase [Candidatus Omnitrophota bacterium]